VVSTQSTWGVEVWSSHPAHLRGANKPHRSSPQVNMFSLKAIALVLTVASLGEAHSLKKRETTVSDFIARQAPQLSRTVTGIDLSTVLVIVFAFILLDILGTALLVLLSGGAGKRSNQGGLFSWGLPSISGLYNNVSEMYNSIDLVDMAFNYMDIEDETCRMKTICQAENYAVNHPVARLAINTINSSFRGLEKYQHAVTAGQNGEDCRLLYDQCPGSYFGLEF